ncbi:MULTISPECIES: SPOCS domain-containing protein [Clostridium]|jgi:LysM repeat protein|uniref:DUF3794 and LysM peptidoglycan-binding domain-containing protein n=1 Tax=Clostridium TaxID=1485 RepID=UPI000288A776|nr:MULTISPECIES: SPOCS domain-containing protein [Clostridium]MDF2505246.1 LysM protein [Clostridium sp.]
MAIELVKENIQYEQLLGENTADTVVQEEYIIPDTQPDVLKILMVDAKPSISNTEVMQDKVYLEGQVEFDVVYLGKTEEGSEICGVSYAAKFSNYVEIEGAAHKMLADTDFYVEHMNCNAVNERKISVEGIIKLKSEVFSENDLEIVKDVTGLGDVQFLKSQTSIDKIAGNKSIDLVAKSHLQVPMENPQIANILKYDVNVHKKQIKVLEGKLELEAFAQVNVLYKGKDNGEIFNLSDDVLLSQEVEFEGVNPTMNVFGDFTVDATECNIKEDDLGENRNVDVEALIKANIKAQSKENVDVIQDAYSPDLSLKIEKRDYEFNQVYDKATTENIVKENLEIKEENAVPTDVILAVGKVSITDKKLVEDKLSIEGIVNTSVIYKTNDENNAISSLNEDIPFSCSIDMPGSKIEMTSIAKGNLENIEASIEANTIAIKAIVSVSGRVNYNSNKDFLINVVPIEGEKPKKKASVTIYTTQTGDSLWKIAKVYFTTVESIVNINNIENPDYILPGQKLIIPGRAAI